MSIGLFSGRRRPSPPPYTEAHLTSAAGEQQAVRYHLARADGGVHVVLQYRNAGEREWTAAQQTICGLRDFTLCDAVGGWCEDICWPFWERHR